MSLALYRTYRPSRLSEVIGQEHVTEPLRRALTSGNVHHAFLFSGPRGCGKTSTARILARSLICEQGPTPDPCGECDFCVALAPNGPGLIDVIELDAASHGGVDDTRELRERAAFVPAQARYKVYIVDEAHMVTKDGFNALLKLIEEPPDHLKFIFATTEVDKVLPTIRSRTFNYAFRLVPSRQLQQNLAGICDPEGVPFEPGALSLISRASGGSVRDAQSIMGQLIAGSGAKGLRQIEVGEQLGVTDEALLDDVVAAVATRDGAQVFSAVTRVVESGHDVRRFVTDLLHQFRDLLLITHIGEAATDDVLDVSGDRREILFAQAKRFGAAELTRLAEVINEGLTHVKGSTSPRLQLEILVARLLIPSSDVKPESLLSRIEVLERRLSAIASGAERPAPSLPTGAAQPASAPPATADAPAQAPPAAATRPTPPTRPTPSGDQIHAGASGPEPASTPERPAAQVRPPATGNPETGAPPAGRPGPPRPPSMSSLRDFPSSNQQQASGPQESGQDQGQGQTVSPPAQEAPARPDPSQQPEPSRQSTNPPTTPPARPPTNTTPPPPTSSAQTPPPPPPPARQAPTAPTAPSAPDPAQEGGAETLNQIRNVWPQLLAHIRESSRVAAASWEGAEAVAVRDDVLTVQVPSKGQEVSIRSARRDLAMRTMLIERFGIDVQVNATSGPTQPVDTPPDVPAPDDPDLGSNDLSGVDLAMRELGATRIGEIEGS